jgi:hypothetical protein
MQCPREILTTVPNRTISSGAALKKSTPPWKVSLDRPVTSMLKKEFAALYRPKKNKN